MQESDRRRPDLSLGVAMEIAFFVDMPEDIPQPAPGGSKSMVTNQRTGRTMLIDAGKHNTAWKKHVAKTAREAVYSVLKQPLDTVLYAQFSFRMPRPQDHYFKDGRLKPSAPYYHTIRPDASKLARAAEDACTKILWSDDSRIALQLVEKIYSERPGVHIYMSDRIPTEIKITI
jgi:Holliday junction resolvase RusA-like endonuclease